jgi:threonine dehydrogenase-like Zn-dependent dehydrogenase
VRVRAAVMEEPGRIAVQSFPYPDPEPGAVVLRMDHSGICGTDKHTWRGESIQYAGTENERTAAYPLICGHENVGVIEAIGPGSPPIDEMGGPLGIGDRVVPAPNLTCGRCRYCLDDRFPYYLCSANQDYGNSLSCAEPPHLFGGWSEAMYLLPGTRMFRVPDGMDPALAALTELVAVTHGLDAAQSLAGTGAGLCFGDSVLVMGVGPLGLVHLLKAELLGAGRLIAIDLIPERVHLALGAETLSPEERRDAVREATAGHGADVVVHCTGRAETFQEALELVRPGGVVIEPGTFVDMGEVAVNPSRYICAKGVTVIGIGGDSLRQYPGALRMIERHADRLRLGSVVSSQVGLGGLEDALEGAAGSGEMKILVTPWDAHGVASV